METAMNMLALEETKAMPKSLPKSWREVYKTHPAAELFPRLTHDELLAIGEDIKKNGLQYKVVFWSKGHRDYDGTPPERLVLDGISRLDAMELVGLQTLDSKGVLKVPNERKYELRRVTQLSVSGPSSGKEQLVTDCDPWAYVLSVNAHRRHLNSEQKREVIEKVATANPQMTNRQIARLVKTSPTTVAEARKIVQSGHTSEVAARSRGHLGDRFSKLEEAIKMNPDMSHAALGKLVGVNDKTVKSYRERLGMMPPPHKGGRKPKDDNPEAPENSTEPSYSRAYREIIKLLRKITTEEKAALRNQLDAE